GCRTATTPGSAPSPWHRRPRAAPDLPAAGLGVSHRRAGGGFGRGGLRPDRRQPPHSDSQPPAAAGRRGSGGDLARGCVIQPGGQPGPVVLVGSIGGGPRFAERVLHPGPGRVQHVDTAGAGQLLAGAAGWLRIPVHQGVAFVGSAIFGAPIVHAPILDPAVVYPAVLDPAVVYPAVFGSAVFGSAVVYPAVFGSAAGHGPVGHEPAGRGPRDHVTGRA